MSYIIYLNFSYVKLRATVGRFMTRPLGAPTGGETVPCLTNHPFDRLASLEQLEFAGWDPIPDNAYEAAKKAGVLEEKLLDAIRPRLEAIKPMPAVFDT